MDNILLKIEDLNIEFHDHDVPERVVNHLDMELAQGEILGIVGESGSGKSMTAMAVAGLLTRHDMEMEGKSCLKERRSCTQAARSSGRFREMTSELSFRSP